jgi:protein SMG6
MIFLRLLQEWSQFWTLRLQLQDIMEQLIKFEMKFCQQENVEHHCWKLLYYNVIELLRKSIIDDTNNSLFYKERIQEIIESGNVYLLHLLAVLEISYKFRLEDFLGENAGSEYRHTLG